METRNYWEENGHAVKYDNYNSNDGFGRAVGELNFAAPSEDEAEFPTGAYLKKGKVSRQDPMSHRIIEKRRRDRMNNCLADLSRLIPPEYLKKGRGRVEKTEIIEMAIRHLKYLQERVNGLYNGTNRQYATERQGEEYHAGYQEAVTEAVRYLVEVQGYGPGDALSAQLAAHLHRHREHIIKGVPTDLAREKVRSQPGSSSETASSSSSSHGYVVKGGGVITQAPPPPAPSFPAEVYEQELAPEQHYQPMDCDRISISQPSTAPESDLCEEPLPLDGRRKYEPSVALRAVRKLDHDDYLQSYKFKNSIERRFSRSQDTEVTESGRVASHCKVYNHKRRRAAKPAPSTSTSNSGSTEDARDTSPQMPARYTSRPHFTPSLYT
ncbi:hairy/enhancer-of-split related with YRPW motif protein [Hyposmocoma kahamanoa]|uniref:hairy/enhancer-of-split related with YRPW motif protein n=1 Tax=Hyposmocoma kahamanoa TaxID=1477025 RepID=UPI000E6D608A|nr:hairy/enhancer-of-split related with YRPW motif protein [Hyposmocoma kahamanoa]